MNEKEQCKPSCTEKDIYLDKAVVRVGFALKNAFGWRNVDLFSVQRDEDTDCVLVSIENYSSVFGECSATAVIHARTINDSDYSDEEIIDMIEERMRLLAWHLAQHVDNIFYVLRAERELFGDKEHIW